jgi:hypothetical protein
VAEVPKEKTATAPSDMITSFGKSFQAASGMSPTKFSIAILMGLWDLETGAGASVFNFNIGNVKVTPAQEAAGVPFYVQPAVTSESNHFRAYGSLDEGTASVVNLIAQNARYASAWTDLRAGDAPGFADDLEAAGYGGDPKVLQGKYSSALKTRIAKWMDKLNVPATPVGPITPSQPAAIATPKMSVVWALVAAAILGGSLYWGLGKKPALGRRAKRRRPVFA